jgi:hypothetical protein
MVRRVTYQAQCVGLLNRYASFAPITKDTKIGIVARTDARAQSGERAAS